jgi:hypothetical protein
VKPVVVEVMPLEVMPLEAVVAIEPVMAAESSVWPSPRMSAAERVPAADGVATTEPTAGVSAAPVAASAAARVCRRAAGEDQHSDQCSEPD